MPPSSQEEMGSQISFIINYTEGWTSGDVHYNAFVKAEKDMKSYQSSPPWFFFCFPSCPKRPISSLFLDKSRPRFLGPLRSLYGPWVRAWLLSPSLTVISSSTVFCHLILSISCHLILSIPYWQSSRNWMGTQDSQHCHFSIHPTLTPPRRPHGPSPAPPHPLSVQYCPTFGKPAPFSSEHLRFHMARRLWGGRPSQERKSPG